MTARQITWFQVFSVLSIAQACRKQVWCSCYQAVTLPTSTFNAQFAIGRSLVFCKHVLNFLSISNCKIYQFLIHCGCYIGLLTHCFISINRFFHSEIRAIDRVLQSMDSSKNNVETQTLLDSIQKTVAKSTKEKWKWRNWYAGWVTSIQQLCAM